MLAVAWVQKGRRLEKLKTFGLALIETFFLLTIPALAQITPAVPAIAASPNPQTDETPEQKKDDGAMRYPWRLGKMALVKARDWESNWFTGVFVPNDHMPNPLTGTQRRELYLEQTLATPGAYMKRMFAAGIDQARGVPHEWDGGWRGYGERFASREGQFISANTLAALGNAVLKDEPRYDQCRCSGFWPRTRHAILRSFMTYGADEQRLRPQLALYGGAFGGGMISAAWKPQPRNAFAEGGRAMLGQAAYGTLLNFFIEFAGDINRKIGAKSRTRPQ